MAKKIRNNILLLTGGAVAGFVLLFLVYCIPVESMKEHIYWSLPMLEKEFESSEMIEGFPGSLTGNFTDCLMLENAVYHSDTHTNLEQILYMYRGESTTGEGWAPGYSLVDYLNGVEQPREVEYARYWHGYLVALKPLLFLTSYNSIRLIASVLQLILVGLVSIACGRISEDFLGKAFLVSMPFLYFFSLYTSLSLSICFYITLGLLLIQLRWDKQFRMKRWYCEFFVAAGMITSYFDFLTYPLITLGFPLCVCLYLDKDKTKRGLWHLIIYSVEWSVGYLGLWASKWILTDLLTDGNTIQDALNTIFERTDAAADCTRTAGFLVVVKQNISVYFNWGFYLLMFGITVWLLCCIYKRRVFINRKKILDGGILFLVACFPFIWYFFTQNHSEEHWIYTYKILSISIFAGVCGVGKICGYNIVSDTREVE